MTRRVLSLVRVAVADRLGQGRFWEATTLLCAWYSAQQDRVVTLAEPFYALCRQTG